MADPTPERIAAALALADADEFHYRNKDKKFAHDAHMAALESYRATLPKLRTSAERDAELSAIMRMAYGAGHIHVISGSFNLTARIEQLCAEATAPEPAPDICCPYTSGHERDCPRWPKAPGHEPVPFLTCADCGLTRDQEPTVAVRWDGRPRCNSCGSKSESNEERHTRMNAAGVEKMAEILSKKSRAEWDGKRECGDCGLLYEGAECPAHFDSDPAPEDDRPCGCEQAEALKDRNTELSRLLGHVHGTVAGLVELLGALP